MTGQHTTPSLVIAGALSLLASSARAQTPGTAAETPQPTDSRAPLGLWARGMLDQEFAFIGGGGACSAASQNSNGSYCVRGDGSQYLGAPLGRPKIEGGVTLSTTRLLVGASYVLMKPSRVTVGAVAGFAFLGGAPKPAGGSSFLPLHLEARGSYWLLRDAYAPRGIQPYVTAAFGLAEVDVGNVEVGVKDANTSQRIDLRAWRRLGRLFLAPGVGGFLPVGKGGIVAELRPMFLFPASGVAISLAVGYTYGF